MTFSLLRNIGNGFANLIYPPLCLHCRNVLHEGSQHLCLECLEQLELIDPAERCPYCFSPEYCLEKRVCSACMKRKPVLNGIAAAFDYIGPAATLVRQIKYMNQSYLTTGCGAYMAAQFLKLNWPNPDLVVPVPISLTHWFERGFNQSQLLAESFAKIINCPMQDIFVRKSGDYSQAGLNQHQRMKLIGNTIKLKKHASLQDKNILIIDDVMTTGSTLRKCGEVLLEEYPATIYALTLCRALK